MALAHSAGSPNQMRHINLHIHLGYISAAYQVSEINSYFSVQNLKCLWFDTSGEIHHSLTAMWSTIVY